MATLVSCHDLAKTYGDRTLFEGVSISVVPGDKIGLIGRNGSGKSTLLKILAGLLDSDGGERMVSRGLQATYVPQETELPPLATVEEVVMAGFDEVDDPRFEAPEERQVLTARILAAFGFERPTQTVDTLSGGWQKRLSLARALAPEPELVLLDEPTNHLDLEGILWLERLLSSSQFSFVVVTHDRVFLERVATRVVELDPRYSGGLLSLEGRYSDFLERREQILESQIKQEASLATKVAREVEWLRQGPKARTTKANYRIKEAERLVAELDDLKSRRSAGKATTTIQFSATDRKTKRLVEATDIAKSLGGKQLFSGVDLLLRPGMRLGIVGTNGSGKTTLMRVLSKELPPDEGSIRHVQDLRVVYFDQLRASLDTDASLRRSLAPDGDSVIYQGRPIHVASWARRFLFRVDQLDMPVRELSGGEQAKILIARLVREPCDLLLLDEPTNDLDIPTLEILGQSLLEFPGAVVIVTHDRYLLDQVTTVLLGLDGTGTATVLADYTQWEGLVRTRGKRQRADKGGEGQAKPTKRATKLSYKDQRRYDELEASMAETEARLAQRSKDMEDPEIARDADKLAALYEEVAALQDALDEAFLEWSELEEQREALETGD